jgi:predicted esterase
MISGQWSVERSVFWRHFLIPNDKFRISRMNHNPDAFSTRGVPLERASSVLILTHGRGADAADILTLAEELPVEGMAYLAPTASGYTWYPNSFLAPMQQNEPGISNGIAVLKSLVDRTKAVGMATEKIFLGGFSQGACLTSEFLARYPDSYGGAMVFTGGLIGPPGTPRHYQGRLDGVPIFIGSSDRDPHVPLWRVEETVQVLTGMGAKVRQEVYPGLPHTIHMPQIEAAREILAVA